MGSSITSPSSKARVQGVSAFSTRQWTRSHWNRALALVVNVPGASDASQPICAPLQIPSTGLPAAAAARTSSITGARAAMAPARR
jgi:hypothetical protein